MKERALMYLKGLNRLVKVWLLQYNIQYTIQFKPKPKFKFSFAY